jgi:hypothetical protein
MVKATLDIVVTATLAVFITIVSMQPHVPYATPVLRAWSEPIVRLCAYGAVFSVAKWGRSPQIALMMLIAVLAVHVDYTMSKERT